jgi:uncharacterized RDD family membrane protein YckC
MRWRTLKKQKHHKPLTPKSEKIVYAPFWPRALGFVTDIFMIGLPITLLTMLLFGYDQMHSASGLDVIVNDPKAHTNPPNPVASIMQMSLFLITYVWLWHKSGQTPGKKLAYIRVVDAKTFENASYWKLTLRFIGYFISLITLVGFFIGLMRKDKRTLHDLLSGTAVIRVS